MPETSEIQNLKGFRRLPYSLEDYSVSGYIDWLLAFSIRKRASDLHFETNSKSLKIKCRIDGLIFEITPPETIAGNSLVARIKILAGLNASETRLSQEGRFSTSVAGHKVDIRISVLPTGYGESVALRFLDQSVIGLELDDLGMPENLLKEVERDIHKSHGLFIATGPTGAGKTTTLYSILKAVNSGDIKILTVEDPVEYELAGIQQIGLQKRLGVTFTSLLRSVLRHDPDRILIGEIRDEQTAAIAVQAALTGHYVYTTLHTGDAIGVLIRMQQLGIPSYILGACLNGILAQRLLRRIDPDAKEKYKPDISLIKRLGSLSRNIENYYRGRPTPQNHYSGYMGRIAIFQYLSLNQELRSLLHNRRTDPELRDRASASGMVSLENEAARLLISGETSLEEYLHQNL